MYLRKIIKTIELLKTLHPKMNVGKHIATALDGEDIWSITDKKFYTLLDNYQSQLDAVDVFDDKFDVDKIIEDGISIGKY